MTDTNHDPAGGSSVSVPPEAHLASTERPYGYAVTLQQGLLLHGFATRNADYVWDALSGQLVRTGRLLRSALEALAERSRRERESALGDLREACTGGRLDEVLGAIWTAQRDRGLFLPVPPNLRVVVSRDGGPADPEHRPDYVGMVLEITEACNCRCSYCIFSGQYVGERLHSTRRLSPQKARQAIEYLLSRTTDARPYISFFGGEPLLAKSEMFALMTYARERCPGVTFGVQTNGLLLDRDTFLQLRSFNARIGISLDGPRQIHDRNRRTIDGHPTFDRVMENIAAVHEAAPDYFRDNVFCRATLESPELIEETFAFFRDHPVLQKVTVFTGSVSSVMLREPKPRSGDGSQHMARARERYVAALLAEQPQRTPLEHALFAPTLHALLTRLGKPLANPVSAPVCPVSQERGRLFVTLEGELRPCERCPRLPHLGNIDGGLDHEAVRSMEDAFQGLCDACSDCWAIGLCRVCYQHAYGKPGVVDRDLRDGCCRSLRSLMDDGMRLYAEVNEQRPGLWERLGPGLFDLAVLDFEPL
jgi:uncharacterized protein